MSTPEENQLPSVEDLQKLSRYAVVAYAARMVQPLFDGGNEQVPIEYIKDIDDAIRIAELFAQKKMLTVPTKVTKNANFGRLPVLAPFSIGTYVSEAAALAAQVASLIARNEDKHAAIYATRVAEAATRAVAHFAETYAADNSDGSPPEYHATSAVIAADVNRGILQSLCRIYSLFKRYKAGDENPIDFDKINIWENGVSPQWWIQPTIDQNKPLIRYWRKNKLNPWNGLEIYQNRDNKSFYVSLPSFDKIPPLPLHPDSISAGTKPEIFSNSNHEHEPCLGIEKIAEALGDVLIHSKDLLCVGIFGTWGSGKSFLMRQVEKYFQRDDVRKEERFILIHYNAWKYRSTPENWAYLYEVFAAKLRETSWFAMIRAGTIRYKLVPIILALFFVSLPLFLQPTPSSFEWEKLFKDKQIDWRMILSIFSICGGSATLVYFLKQLLQPVSSMAKRFTLPNHQDKLGLQAAIGDDFHALIRGWTTIKPGEPFFSGQSPTAGSVKIVLYVTLWITALLSFCYLLEQFDHNFLLKVLAASFLLEWD